MGRQTIVQCKHCSNQLGVAQSKFEVRQLKRIHLQIEHPEIWQRFKEIKQLILDLRREASEEIGYSVL